MGLTIQGVSPYDVGATQLQQIQSDLDKLSKLKTNSDTYRHANDPTASGGFWGWLDGGNDRADKANQIKQQSAEQIKQQNALEDDARRQLLSLAASNERGQLKPEILKAAQEFDGQLDTRLGQDYKSANAADTSGNSDLAQTAYERANDGGGPTSDLYGSNLHAALFGIKPDVLAPKDTQVFMDQVTSLNKKIVADDQIYHDTSLTQTQRDDALTRLKGEAKEFLKQFDVVDKQFGDIVVGGGVIGPKISALPDGDAEKAAYIKQGTDLLKLIRNGGALFTENGILADDHAFS